MKTQKLFFIGLFVLMGNLLMAQCTCKDLPEMYVQKNVGKHRNRYLKEFKDKKFLNKAYKPVIIPIYAFTDFLEKCISIKDVNSKQIFSGLRIYVGSHLKGDSTTKRGEYRKKMALIFVPNYKNDKGVDVNVHDSDFVWNNETGFANIKSLNAAKMVDNYNEGFRKYKLDIIDYGTNGTPVHLDNSDTRSIFYDSEKINSLYCELTECQKDIITGMRISFTTVQNSDSDEGSTVKNKNYYNRTIVQFAMIRKRVLHIFNSNYSIEDIKSQRNRIHKERLLGNDVGFDTGDLYPPSTYANESF